MVVYFRKMNTLFMILGIVIAAAIGLVIFQGRILVSNDIPRLFYFVLLLVAGLVCGRVAAAYIANSRLRNLYAILYQNNDPKGFIDAFEPLLRKVPKELAEYMDGCCHLSFAHEALGEFDQADAVIRDLKPEDLKLHALPVAARITNQKANLRILSNDPEEAKKMINDLDMLRQASEKRAPMLAQNLAECIKLHTARLNALQNSAETDTAYLADEIANATNEIHKKEIQLELAQFFLLQGRTEEAKELLDELLASAHSLYAEKKAGEILSAL